MILNYSINSEVVAEALAAKGEALTAAVAEAIGLAGESLYEAVVYNMTGGIIKSKTGALVAAVQKSAVITYGTTSTVWVEIPDNGSFEHLVGMVLEFGGTREYEIVPLEARFGEQLGLFGGGARIDRSGVESMFSAEGSPALAEGRLPHTLAWEGPGGMVFAKRVIHPPSKEFAFLRTSLTQVEEKVRIQITEAIAGVAAA